MQFRNIFPVALLAVMLSQSGCIKDYDNPAHGTPGTDMKIYALRQIFNGNPVSLNSNNTGGASFIEGTVISDKNGANIESGSFVLQQTVASPNSLTDLTAGIRVQLSSGNHPYETGDSLRINISNGTLDRINGRLTVSDIASSQITVLATGTSPLVRDVNTGLLNDNMQIYESTLVALHANVDDYGTGVTYAGAHNLSDATGEPVVLLAETGASFAGNQVAVNAQFTGIVDYYNPNGKTIEGANITISPRNAGDINFESGPLYAGWPESFESPDATTKSSYNSGTNLVDLSTGNWYLLQAILATTFGSDKINSPGKQAVRMQQNLSSSGYIRMNFDVPDGASKVTVFYGKYATDARSAFRLDYSVDGGTSWIAASSNITDMPTKGNKQATFMVDVDGPVRFRIHKIGLGSGNNGRLCIDDFAIYKKL